MRAVQAGPISGLVGQVLLLGVLEHAVGLHTTGWVVGVGFGVVTSAALAHALARAGADGLGPADRVTLARATLVGGVAALTADLVLSSANLAALVTLGVIALVLDNVDGRVARRTDTISALGARFDMEVDAALILVLSVCAARTAGAWVLAIGAARYVFVAAGWVLPWLRGILPPRYWPKVVAATQGVVLTVYVADVLPHSLALSVVGLSLVLLLESFGHDVWWLWRHRSTHSEAVEVSAGSLARTGGPR